MKTQRKPTLTGAGAGILRYSHETLEQVRKNMEQPIALKFRNNTGNRAYGFEQTFKNK
jgi:hypothetical protein